MHIDHSKLVELLTETSGIEKETVEKYLSELVAEINEALEEGEAYEVDGFGVFSQIGENTLFIPTDDLATEINYKYAGMSPILLDEDRDKGEPEPTDDEADEDPFAGLLDDITEPEQKPESIKAESDDIDTTDVDDLSDPFVLEDEESAEEEVVNDDPEEEGFKEIPNGINYRSESEEDDSRVLFSGLLEMDEDEGDEKAEEDAEDQEETDLQPDPEFRELETDLGEEKNEDSFDLGDDDTLSEKETEDEAEVDVQKPALEAEAEPSPEAKDKGVEEDQDVELSETETSDEINDEEEIEEDPFETLAGDNGEEEIEDEDDIIAIKDEEPESQDTEEEQEKEVIPIIKNVASEKKRNKKKLKKETKKPKEPVSKAPAPVLLWVILFIVIIGGGIYGLGYFGVVDIPGITPAGNQSQQMAIQQNEEPESETTTQQSLQEATDADQQATEEPDEPEETTSQAEDPVQETTADVESTIQTRAAIPEGQEEYGMEGVPVESANDGYTIVVFSLSNQQNAEAQKTELESEGYRVLLAEIPSQQYGSLWRVSLGQFESMRDAAIAAEDLDTVLSGNYFITKIQ
jgi:hypothetical protein